MRDHEEIVISADFAGASNRGLKHDSNEDRFALDVSASKFAMVVCDGVSSSANAEVAATLVVQHVMPRLAQASLTSSCGLEKTMREAIEGADGAIPSSPGSPSTTIVAALVANGEIVLGWVGDSRAYWIGDREEKRLTKDHSWLEAVVSSETLSLEEAQRTPLAHVLTRWLGKGGAESHPDTELFVPPGPGYLLLCTDGLWNYASEPEKMANLVRAAAKDEGSAIRIVRKLIEFACLLGGHDNITVILLKFS